MPAQVAVFAEALLTSLLSQLKKGKAERHESVIALFRNVPSGLGSPLKDFLSRVVSKGEMTAGKKERRLVEEGCKSAVHGLEEAEREGEPRGTDGGSGLESDEEDEGEDW